MVCPVLLGDAEAACALLKATVATERTAALAALVANRDSSVMGLPLNELATSIERVSAAMRFFTSVGLVIVLPLTVIGVVGRPFLRVNEIDDATN